MPDPSMMAIGKLRPARTTWLDVTAQSAGNHVQPPGIRALRRLYLAARPCVGPVFGVASGDRKPKVHMPSLPTTPRFSDLRERVEMKLSHGITPHTRIVAFGGVSLTRRTIGFKLDDIAVKQVWLCTQEAFDAGPSRPIHLEDFPPCKFAKRRNSLGRHWLARSR
ncbi:uncharacterized protein LY79DRAFT_118582 [Colletotrichum navitas]|uniref:Uncharacterized protein n=1 Tax=Colletotrichum navitas TaxID=681940 RepID=A0AAD8V7B4_9PEZI|nr:uncharacterized protein LY79DRAFT_118582 [Colletotrichum navitas]KAK1595083.1 hypothetical protein LY79DRAFT_118582 [Colletotrichum navitas]